MNVTEISHIVFNLKSSKSAGYDEISWMIIKSVIPCITKPLCKMFNISFSTGEFSDKLKIAKVSPNFKSDDMLPSNNYQTTSVFPVFSKIMERLMYN